MNQGRDRADAALGCLLGGAIGDALGYSIEFMRCEEIQKRFGEGGLRDYVREPATGRARISDDTQMTLYTAEGLLIGAEARRGGSRRPLVEFIADAYLNWYGCQAGTGARAGGRSPLSELPEMRPWRAPGNTCMGALGSGWLGSIEAPVNHSAGCGGVMRVAPIALLDPAADIGMLARLGARAAALTHGHPLGWLSAAAQVWIVRRCALEGRDANLRAISRECRAALPKLFPGEPCARDMADLLARVEALSENNAPDARNIRALGEGWVGHEALAIALYCALRYADDFSACVIAAVNHGGDSDSTGAIAGNILGARLGAAAIETRWLDGLELRATIEETARVLCEVSLPRE